MLTCQTDNCIAHALYHPHKNVFSVSSNHMERCFHTCGSRHSLQYMLIIMLRLDAKMNNVSAVTVPNPIALLVSGINPFPVRGTGQTSFILSFCVAVLDLDSHADH